MKYKNILVTGGRGFIGFNALQLWKNQYKDTKFTCLDANTYADKFMEDVKDRWIWENDIGHYQYTLGKPGADDYLEYMHERHGFDAIVHFAAESHVDNSIKTPNVFFESNVMGTVDILNFARKHDIRVHIVSTDEVYGPTLPDSWINAELSAGGAALEFNHIEPLDMKLSPSSPYSSSKASADMIALSYFKTFGTKVTISRCTNNAGKFQHVEKLIGTVISKALRDETIPVYGNGEQRRHWIHVDDHNNAVMDILENGTIGGVYNIAPCAENWISNLEMVHFIVNYLEKSWNLIKEVTDRPGHDTSYFMFPTLEMKSRKYTEFMPEVIDWYVENIGK